VELSMMFGRTMCGFAPSHAWVRQPQTDSSKPKGDFSKHGFDCDLFDDGVSSRASSTSVLLAGRPPLRRRKAPTRSCGRPFDHVARKRRSRASRKAAMVWSKSAAFTNK
jgi:hypothetical protein